MDPQERPGPLHGVTVAVMIGLLAAAAAGAALDLAGAPALLGGPLAAAAGLLVMPLAAWLLDRARRR